MKWPILMSFLVGTALAQTPTDALFKVFQAAPNQHFYLDLDSAEGSYSQWRNDDLGTLNAIRGSVVIKRITTHIKWLPTFFIALAKNAPERASETPDSVRVQISSPDHRPPLEIRIIQYHNGQVVADEKLSKTLELNEKMDVELFFVMPDTIILNLGNAGIRKVKVSWKPASAVIIGSSGQMKVEPLDLGTVNP
jgi:hypothetical protein